MDILRTSETLFAHINRIKAAGKTLALVPTMGALHAGHLSLIECAKKHASLVAASIFVNPTQFGPNEDLARYPRPEGEDIRALERVHTDTLYIPDVASIYPRGTRITIRAGKQSSTLCGTYRPGHFDGVVTVVHHLFSQVRPDVAVFGEKDFQQLFLIREMVAAEKLPVTIIAAPIMREADGLAFSSRNRYLMPNERAHAPLLYKTLQSLAAEIRQGKPPAPLFERAIKMLGQNGFEVDYIELRDSKTLEVLTAPSADARLFIAAKLGTTRLIDNLLIN